MSQGAAEPESRAGCRPSMVVLGTLGVLSMMAGAALCVLREKRQGPRWLPIGVPHGFRMPRGSGFGGDRHSAGYGDEDVPAAPNGTAMGNGTAVGNSTTNSSAGGTTGSGNGTAGAVRNASANGSAVEHAAATGRGNGTGNGSAAHNGTGNGTAARDGAANGKAERNGTAADNSTANGTVAGNSTAAGNRTAAGNGTTGNGTSAGNGTSRDNSTGNSTSNLTVAPKEHCGSGPLACRCLLSCAVFGGEGFACDDGTDADLAVRLLELTVLSQRNMCAGMRCIRDCAAQLHCLNAPLLTACRAVQASYEANMFPGDPGCELHCAA